jgi:hypothetical protein
MNDSDRQFDAALKAALQDVPVPPGLAERLLACCDAAESAAEPSPPLVSVAAARPRFSRRALWLAGAGAALAASMLLAALLWPRAPQSVSVHELAAIFPDWLAASEHAAPASALPKGYQLPANLRVLPQGYRQFVTRQSWPAVAASLAPSGSPQATLFIVRSKVSFQVPQTPVRLPATAGNSAVAWQVRDLLYVLVVEERGQRLEDFLAPVRQA